MVAMNDIDLIVANYPAELPECLGERSGSRWKQGDDERRNIQPFQRTGPLIRAKGHGRNEVIVVAPNEVLYHSRNAARLEARHNVQNANPGLNAHRVPTAAGRPIPGQPATSQRAHSLPCAPADTPLRCRIRMKTTQSAVRSKTQRSLT